MKSNNIVTGTIIFSVITFFPPAMNLFLMPLYVKYLSIEEYGVLSLMTGISAFFTVVGALRVSTAITSYYYEYQHDPVKLQTFYGNTLKFAILINLGLGLASSIPIFLIISFLIKNPAIEFASLGLPAMAIGLISSIRACYLVFCKNDRNIKKYSIHYILITIIISALQVLLLTVFDAGVKGLMIARLIAELIGLIMVVIEEKKVLNIPFKKEYLHKMLTFSLPLIPSGIVGWVYTFGDRFFIEQYLDLSMLGLYGFLVTLISLITMLSDAILHGSQPYLYNLYAEGIEQNTSKINMIYRFYIQAIVVFCASLILLGHNLDLIIANTDYLPVSKYITFGITIFFVEAYYKLFLNNLLFTKKTRWISLISIFSTLATVLFYIIFIPVFQIWGVILANLLCNLLSTLIAWKVSQQKLKLALSLKDFITIPSIQIMVFAVFQFYALTYKEQTKQLSAVQLLLVITIAFIVLRKDFPKITAIYKKMIY